MTFGHSFDEFDYYKLSRISSVENKVGLIKGHSFADGIPHMLAIESGIEYWVNEEIFWLNPHRILMFHP